MRAGAFAASRARSRFVEQEVAEVVHGERQLVAVGREPRSRRPSGARRCRRARGAACHALRSRLRARARTPSTRGRERARRSCPPRSPRAIRRTRRLRGRAVAARDDDVPTRARQLAGALEADAGVAAGDEHGVAGHGAGRSTPGRRTVATRSGVCRRVTLRRREPPGRDELAEPVVRIRRRLAREAEAGTRRRLGAHERPAEPVPAREDRPEVPLGGLRQMVQPVEPRAAAGRSSGSASPRRRTPPPQRRPSRAACRRRSAAARRRRGAGAARRDEVRHPPDAALAAEVVQARRRGDAQEPAVEHRRVVGLVLDGAGDRLLREVVGRRAGTRHPVAERPGATAASLDGGQEGGGGGSHGVPKGERSGEAGGYGLSPGGLLRSGVATQLTGPAERGRIVAP